MESRTRLICPLHLDMTWTEEFEMKDRTTFLKKIILRLGLSG